MSIPHKARERLLLVGGGRFRGMSGDGKSRRGALPPDSLVAHLPACRAATADLTALAQGRTIDAGKLRFAERSLFDTQQIARIYRDDGLFFGAVKIENDTARTLRLLP